MKYNPGEYTLRVVYAFLPFSISVILLIIVSLAESREKKADQFIDSYLYGSFSLSSTTCFRDCNLLIKRVAMF